MLKQVKRLRTCNMQVRLRHSERRAIQRAAAERDETVSHFVRRAIMRAVTR